MRLLCLCIAFCLSVASASAKDWKRASERLVEAGEASIAAGDFVEAIRTLESAVAADPTNVEAFEALGHAYFGMNRFGQAEKYFLIALEIDPTSADSLAYLGEIDLRKDERQAAADKLARLSRICGVECAEYKRLAGAISRAAPAADASPVQQ